MCKTAGLFVVFTMCLYGVSVNARRSYQQFIPNGGNVPNPCTDDPTDVWARVGHNGTTSKGNNKFGEDFAAAVNTSGLADAWSGTEGLCHKDSDMDGRTNGQELGDPGCKWTYTESGSTPEITDITKLSHPGIKDKFVAGKLTIIAKEWVKFC